jgi:putative phage-type endonuclease
MIEQGSPDWLALRCGKATASRIADIVRKTKTGTSATRDRYMGQLIAERLTGAVADSYKSADMEWGTATEAEARIAYEFHHNVPVEPIDFVTHPTITMSGASPDGLIGTDGLIEIKCPATHTHVATLLKRSIEPDYMIQMQWQMACTGRQWCDFASYDPRMPEHMRLWVHRVHRDAEHIAQLEDAVGAFLVELDDRVNELRAAYPEPTQQAAE